MSEDSNIHHSTRELIQGLGLGELPPALDVEGFRGTKGLPNRLIVDNAIACLEEIERSTGIIPLLYTGPSFWKYHLSLAPRCEELKRWPLWEASYDDHPHPMPWPETACGTRYTFWQHSGSGVVPGVEGDCDVNVFAGTEEQLRVLVGGSA